MSDSEALQQILAEGIAQQQQFVADQLAMDRAYATGLPIPFPVTEDKDDGTTPTESGSEDTT